MNQSVPNAGIRFIALLGGMLAFSSANAEESDSELQQVQAVVTGMFDSIAADDISASPIDGWYQIHKGSIVAYVSADGRYLLQGDLIDLESSQNLSEDARTEGRRELMTQLTDDRVITFSPDEPKYSVSVFTDVDCSYRRRLHGQIDEYMAQGIEVRYVLYPRNGPATASWNTAEEVWCSANRNDALTQAKLDRKFETSQCDASTISENFVVGQQVGLNGTPAIVLEDGTLIGGYVTPQQLAMQLEQNANK